ncbi:coiled-coil domain-containing protein 173 [Takifugu rubripes]|uniref:Cilia and flagella associated protein 210 n=1 Tax=Takifugu rubripes TaxID=31033 RepID=H2V9D1_TAKRU|nr:coiled-coil domain-containing protein 173 [Takifugu rubripes]
METEVQHGRRKTSLKKVDDASGMFQFPDLRQVTVLSKAEWQRIQRELDRHNPEKERRTEAKEREVLHQQSVEVVKQWSNTIAGQRQKKLEAKKIRDEVEEEKRKQIDREEAKFQAQKRKEAVEKAKTQLYYQSDHVRGLHSALLLTEVLKEREAQIDLKERIKNTTRDVEKQFLEAMKTREDEAQRQEEERALQRKMVTQAVAEDLRKQVGENKVLKEQQKVESKREGEEIQQLTELYQWEQRMERERQVKQKKDLMQAHVEHVANRDSVRATEEEKQKTEEERRTLFLSAKEKMMKLRKDRETELLREARKLREGIMKDLTVAQQEQWVSEEQRIVKAVAEQEAKQAQQWWEEEERRATMLRAIREHRELTRQEKEQRQRAAKQTAKDELEAKREADRIFKEKQRSKALQIKEDRIHLQGFNATQTAQKSAQREVLRKGEQELEKMNAELMAQEAREFHQYSQQVIRTAAAGQRNIIPLCKAAREAFGGGFDPACSGIRPVYLVQDQSGAQMPQYVSEDVKKLNQAVDIQAEKKRLGFTW